MDWILFGIGFVMGAATTIMGVMGAVIYENASKRPLQPLWEVFDAEGNPVYPNR